LVGFDGEGVEVLGKALAQGEVEIGVHGRILSLRGAVIARSLATKQSDEATTVIAKP
jgi:hypothetical protein